jgi:hypothetical protein
MRRRDGFTLIEVLIASTILFASLTVVSLAFSVNAKSSLAARSAARAVAPVLQIVASIQGQIRANPIDTIRGAGELLGVRYSFEAQIRERRAPPARFDPDRAEFVRYPDRFRLYEVTLEVRNFDSVRRFKYLELAWSAETEPL